MATIRDHTASIIIGMNLDNSWTVEWLPQDLKGLPKAWYVKTFDPMPLHLLLQRIQDHDPIATWQVSKMLS